MLEPPVVATWQVAVPRPLLRPGDVILLGDLAQEVCIRPRTRSST